MEFNWSERRLSLASKSDKNGGAIVIGHRLRHLMSHDANGSSNVGERTLPSLVRPLALTGGLSDVVASNKRQHEDLEQSPNGMAKKLRLPVVSSSGVASVVHGTTGNAHSAGSSAALEEHVDGIQSEAGDDDDSIVAN